MKPCSVLVVDDEKLIRWTLGQTLGRAGHNVLEAADGERALELARSERPGIVLLDLRLPGIDGMEVLRTLRREQPDCAVVMISAHGTLEMAVEAMKLGATDYLKKPFEPEEVELLVRRLTEKIRLERQVDLYKQKDQKEFAPEQLIGGSSTMQRARDLILRVARSGASNILVEGESGTGKGLASRVIHQLSGRREQPFVEVSCTSLADNLVESELFGHERGAFTDAKVSKRGLFELADGGVLFLDEIGDMPLGSQAKLLRALEDRKFKHVGGLRDQSVDVMVVAATNRNLEEAVQLGTFRQDLFYRLAVLRIELPTLRQRREDIPELCAHFVHRYSCECGRAVAGIEPNALERLVGFDWPGIVRELRNVIERAIILGDGERIRLRDLPPDLTSGEPAQAERVTGLTMAGMERELIVRALERAGGNQSQAARLLNISRDTLRYRLKKHGIHGNGAN